MLLTRDQEPDDVPAIRDVLLAAFPTPEEADLVDRLRDRLPNYLGLVALHGDAVVGHALFTPVTLQTERGIVEGFGLAPLAVHPDHQRRGIGAALVEEGLRRLRAGGCSFVVVLGHPEYYPRFGFEPASRHGVRCQWDQVPDDAFMIQVLAPDSVMSGGVVHYRPEFESLT
jgi:putative acetyltransferase